MSILTKRVNRILNKETIKNKVFCIGLHKTGTTTLSSLFKQYGFYSIHNRNWMSSDEKIKMFDFFSDGGSHFDGDNEFNFQKFYEDYPQAKFILQTRDAEKWIISKLKHAGWEQGTLIEKDDIRMITHFEWRYKSLLTVQKLLEHKFNYEEKVLKFFNDRDISRLIIIDITNIPNQTYELKKIIDFLKLKSINRIHLPHSNQVKNDRDIPEIVKDHIKKIIDKEYNKRK